MYSWSLKAEHLPNWFVFISCGLLGGISSLGHPPYGWTFVSFVCFFCFFSLLRTLKNTPLQTFLNAWAFGFFYFFFGLSWIATSFEVVDLHALKPLVMSIIPAILALFWGAAGSLSKKIKGPFFFSSVAFFSAVEYLRGHIFTGFPWNLVGYINDHTCLQLLKYVGPYGLTFLTFCLVCSRVKFFIPLAVSLKLACFMLPVSLNDEEPTSITVRLVQPCVEQRLKWKREHFYDIVSTYIDLSFTQKEGFKPKIIIWPEAALPLFLNENPEFIHLLSGLLPDDTYLITGSLRRDAQNDIFNSLYILKGQHGIVSFYDKAHLVPFGEYLPFRSYLPSFIQKITPGAKDYSCGDGPKTLSLDTLTTFSPLICYESIFSNVRSPERPDFLLTITNDGWFGSSFGPVQHLHQAKARAIEEGLPLIRVGNNGISAVIDASGAILSSLALNEKGVLDAFIPKPHKKTLYATFGDNFFFLALGLFFAIALVRIKYKSKDNA